MGRRYLKFVMGDREKKIEVSESCRGSVSVLVVAFLPIALLLVGLSVDAARVMAAKTELYKASDIAAREMARGIDVVEASESGQQVRYLDDDLAADHVAGNLDGLCGAALTGVCAVENGSEIIVESRARVPLLFSGVAGRRQADIKVTSRAVLKAY